MRNNKNGLYSFSIGLESSEESGDRVKIYTVRDYKPSDSNSIFETKREYKEYYPTRESVNRIHEFIKYNPPKVTLEIDRPTPARFNGRYYDYIDIELYTVER